MFNVLMKYKGTTFFINYHNFLVSFTIFAGC